MDWGQIGIAAGAFVSGAGSFWAKAKHEKASAQESLREQIESWERERMDVKRRLSEVERGLAAADETIRGEIRRIDSLEIRQGQQGREFRDKLLEVHENVAHLITLVTEPASRHAGQS